MKKIEAERFFRELIENLEAALKANKRNASWAADELKISDAQMSRLLKGKRPLNEEMVIKIAGLTDKLNKQLSLVS